MRLKKSRPLADRIVGRVRKLVSKDSVDVQGVNMLMVRKFKHITSLMLVSMLISACTRPDSDTSKIDIVIPKSMSSQKIGTLGTELLTHVVINISGPGIQEPILFEWSNRGPNDLPNPNPPTSFSFDIPQGDNRLIQVLTVYSDTETSIMSFYYGDAEKSLKAAQESVAIAVSSVGKGEVIVTGQISGRYFDSASGGPTGKVFVKFKPSETKPSLILEKSKIVNGWFNFFAMQGAKFEYVMDNGKVLFGKPVDLTDPMFVPTSANSQKLLKVTLPAANRNQSHSGGQEWRFEEPQIHVFGWFAEPGFESALSNKFICRPNSPIALTKMGQFSTASPSAARTLLTPLLNEAVPTNTALYNLASPLGSYYINGGLENSNASCSPDANKYINFLTFKESMVDGNGKDGAVPFFTPFKSIDVNGYGSAFAISQPTVGTKKINGQLLPGLLPLFDRIIAFKRIGPDFEKDSNSLSCRAVAGGAFGFIPAGQANISSDNVELDIALSAAEVSAQVNVLVCVAKGDQLFDGGVFLRSHNWSDSNSNCISNCGPPNNTPLAANNFNVHPQYTQIGHNQCHGGVIELKNTTSGMDSHNVTNTSDITFNISGITTPNSGPFEFYTMSDCATPTSTYTLTHDGTNNSKKIIYYKSSGSSPGPINATFTPVSFGMGPVNFNLQVAAATTPTKFEIPQHLSSFNLSENQCLEIPIFATDSMGYTSSYSSGSALVLSLKNPDGTTYAGGGFNLEISCDDSTPLSSITFSGQFKKSVAIRKTSSNAANAVLNIFFGPFGSFTKNIYLNIAPIRDSIQLTLNPGSNFYQGQCLQISAEPRTGASANYFTLSGVPLSLMFSNSGPVQRFTTDSCTASNSSAPEFPNAALFNGYFKLQTGTGNINLFASSPFVQNSANLPITVNPSPGGIMETITNVASKSIVANSSGSLNWGSSLIMSSDVQNCSNVSTDSDPQANGLFFGFSLNNGYCNQTIVGSYQNWTVLLRVKNPVTKVDGSKIFSLMSTGPSEVLSLSLKNSSGFGYAYNGNFISGSVASESFHNVILRYNQSAQTLKIRINGVDFSTVTSLSLASINNAIDLGNSGNSFNGHIKAFSFISRELSNSEAIDMENYLNGYP